MGIGLFGASLRCGTAQKAVQTPTIPLAEIRQIIPRGFALERALTTGMTSFGWLKAKERYNGWRACPDFDSGLKRPKNRYSKNTRSVLALNKRIFLNVV